MQVCYYRDKQSINKFKLATVTAAGVKITEPFALETEWGYKVSCLSEHIVKLQQLTGNTPGLMVVCGPAPMFAWQPDSSVRLTSVSLVAAIAAGVCGSHGECGRSMVMTHSQMTRLVPAKLPLVAMRHSAAEWCSPLGVLRMLSKVCNGRAVYVPVKSL